MEKKKKFAEFIGLLNDLKAKGKISAEEFRTYSMKWHKNPELRKTLLERLTQLK